MTLYWLFSVWDQHEICDGQSSDIIFLIPYLYLQRKFWQKEHTIRIRRGEHGKVLVESIPGQRVSSYC